MAHPIRPTAISTAESTSTREPPRSARIAGQSPRAHGAHDPDPDDNTEAELCECTHEDSLTTRTGSAPSADVIRSLLRVGETAYR